MGRDIEARIPNAHPLIRNRDPRRAARIYFPVFIDDRARDLGEFCGGAVFDFDGGAGGRLEVDAGGGCGDYEFYVVVFGEHGEGVGADFVGGVAVTRDAAVGVLLACLLTKQEIALGGLGKQEVEMMRERLGMVWNTYSAPTITAMMFFSVFLRAKSAPAIESVMSVEGIDS